MSPRLLVAVAAAVAFALAPSASGAARVCHLVVDAKDDQRIQGNHAPDGVYESPDLEILGGDVASNKRYVTAVLRLASLRDVDTNVPTGRRYTAAFNVGKTRYSMYGVYGADGQNAGAWNDTKGVGVGGASVVWDFARGEVRLTAPVRYFGLSNGMKLTSLVLTSQHFFGSGGRSFGGPVGGYYGATGVHSTVDSAAARRDYVAGTPSCVSVAR